MNLYQSSTASASILNNIWTNSSGQAIYKVSTTGNRLTRNGRVTTIERIIPNPSVVDGDHQTELESLDFRDHFTLLGSIQWKILVSSIFKFKDHEPVAATKFLRKCSWGAYGRHRTLQGPDGREYKWMLGFRIPTLVLNDGSDTVVARFHRRSLGVFSQTGGRPAYLEILTNEFLDQDLIFYTFIYVEKIRKEKEKAARRNGGGG